VTLKGGTQGAKFFSKDLRTSTLVSLDLVQRVSNGQLPTLTKGGTQAFPEFFRTYTPYLCPYGAI